MDFVKKATEGVKGSSGGENKPQEGGGGAQGSGDKQDYVDKGKGMMGWGEAPRRGGETPALTTWPAQPLTLPRRSRARASAGTSRRRLPTPAAAPTKRPQGKAGPPGGESGREQDQLR